MYKTQYHGQTSLRVDRFLSTQLAELSREQVKSLVKQGFVKINHEIITKPRSLVTLGDVISVDIVAWKKSQFSLMSPIPTTSWKDLVKIIKQEPDFLIVDKPAGLLVHRTNNPSSYSLVEILKDQYPEISGVSDGGRNQNGNLQDRDGIVHRIDKDTSGLLVVARNLDAYYYFKSAFANREVYKGYQCLVHGIVSEDQGEISFPITRSKLDHTRRVAIMDQSDQEFYRKKRSALTEYQVIHRYLHHTLLYVMIKTGRTHQIRVHMKALGHPIVGDRVYGIKADKHLVLPRQFLHAHELGFEYKGQKHHFTSPLAIDLQTYLKTIEL